ncbi:MAG: hypothetical protein Kow002_09640 [Anaerolineales bacterium]
MPTPYPAEYLPTVIALTANAAMNTMLAETQNAPPTATSTLTETPVPPTPLPSLTPTPSPLPPGAQIRILAPGPMSKVTSPLSLRMEVVAGGSDLVQVELVGEDGRLLARTLERVPSRPSGVYVSMKIPFEVRSAGELARLTVSTKDERGRMQSLASLHVLLLSIGEDDFTPVSDFSERLVIYSPGPEMQAIGGELYVEGRFQPFNAQQVVMELVGEDGRVIGTRILTFNGLESQWFSTTIPYKISDVTNARLVIRQDDDRIDGLFYLYSQEIVLNP